MTTKAMENLWQYICSLSLTNQNKLWLADHLYEEVKGEDEDLDYSKLDVWGPTNEEEAIDAIMAAEQDIEEGNVVSVDDLLKETRKKIANYEN